MATKCPYLCIAHTDDLELSDEGNVYLVLESGRLNMGPLCGDVYVEVPTLLRGQVELLEERARELAHPAHGDPGLLTE